MRRLSIERAVERDNAAERRRGVGLVSLIVGVLDVIGTGNATGIGMLDDHAGRFSEQADALDRCISIGDVVEGKLFTLELPRGGNASRRSRLLDIERGLLVRVLAIAHVLRLDKLHAVAVPELDLDGFTALVKLPAAQVVRHDAIITGGMLERLNRQAKTLGSVEPPIPIFHRVEHDSVVRVVHNHRHGTVILGGGPQH